MLNLFLTIDGFSFFVYSYTQEMDTLSRVKDKK